MSAVFTVVASLSRKGYTLASMLFATFRCSLPLFVAPGAFASSPLALRPPHVLPDRQAKRVKSAGAPQNVAHNQRAPPSQGTTAA